MRSPHRRWRVPPVDQVEGLFGTSHAHAVAASEAGVEPVVGRRVWVGADPPVGLERQRDDLVRSTVPVYNRGGWMPPDQMIVHGDEEAVAQQLVAVVVDTGATALNLRVHVPGLDPEEALNQIGLVGSALEPVRRAFDRRPQL